MKKTILLLSVQMLLVLSTVAQTNTNLGTNAGSAGANNTALGYVAGDVVTGTANTFVGSNAGPRNTSANNNTFVGYESGWSTTTGGDNTFLGVNSGLYNTTGYQNVFLGTFSGTSNTTGYNNIFLGRSSGYVNTTGYNNVYIGESAAANNALGVKNTFLGSAAGATATSGSSNVFIGFNAGYSESGSNKLYIANTSTPTPLIYGDFSTKQLGINMVIAPSNTNTLSIGGAVYSSGNVTSDGTVSGAAINGTTVTGTNVNGTNINGTTITGTTISTTGTLSGVNIKAGGMLVADNTYPTPAANDLVVQGHIAIGTKFTTNPNSYLLAVNGRIGAKDLQIEGTSSTWSDYAFDDNYKLPTLEEVQLYITKNHHLQGVPSTKEVEEKGYSTNQMISTLLLKVEELTLYVIEQQKEIEALKKDKKHNKGR
ncbi:MAG TPA: hypothetical protein VL443_26260 [Cyclobacteriaceae bacterium]|jgi:hypothetical protein|nr:hypothetical protein [Cyclobacteriaceae bacterium]